MLHILQNQVICMHEHGVRYCLHARAWRVLHILQNQVIYVHEHGVRVAYFETFYFTNPYLSFFFESTPNYNCVLSSVCGGDIGVCLC